MMMCMWSSLIAFVETKAGTPDYGSSCALAPLSSHTPVRSRWASTSLESQSDEPTAGTSRTSPPETSNATEHRNVLAGYSIRHLGAPAHGRACERCIAGMGHVMQAH